MVGIANNGTSTHKAALSQSTIKTTGRINVALHMEMFELMLLRYSRTVSMEVWALLEGRSNLM